MEKERKHQIIRAAIKRFSKHGLKKTTLDEVARDLRIGKATIYHYFLSKEELYSCCLELEASLFISELKSIFINEASTINFKLAEYFNLKGVLAERYKLIYSFFVEEIKGALFENEKKLLEHLISEEREIINSELNKVTLTKKDFDKQAFTQFLVNHSWALLFSSQVTNIFTPATPLPVKDVLINIFESYLV